VSAPSHRAAAATAARQLAVGRVVLTSFSGTAVFYRNANPIFLIQLSYLRMVVQAIQHGMRWVYG